MWRRAVLRRPSLYCLVGVRAPRRADTNLRIEARTPAASRLYLGRGHGHISVVSVCLLQPRGRTECLEPAVHDDHDAIAYVERSHAMGDNKQCGFTLEGDRRLL